MKENFKFLAPTKKVLKSASKNPLESLNTSPISQKHLIHVSYINLVRSSTEFVFINKCF